jgi:superkiller protein 3
MITVEQARQLVGDDVPNDPEILPEFLELLDGVVKDHSEEWVKDHKKMLHSQWEYVATLIEDAAKLVLKEAIKNGGNKVKCFDGFLPSYYKQFGFKEVRRVKWDDQLAPENWNYDKDGRPDVVYMELGGVEKSNIMGFQIKESDANLLASVLRDLMNEGKAEQAAVIARLLEDSECADPERWLLLGLQAAHADDLDSAETRFKKALELGGRDPRLYYELSIVLALKGEDLQAVVWAEKTVEAAPDVAIGYFHLARLHAAKDRVDEARSVLRKVMDSEDFSEESKDEAGKKLGLIFMNAQRYEEAIPYLEKAALTKEKDADLWMKLAHCYSRAGNLEGALEAFRKAVAIDTSPDNLYGLGDCLLALDWNKDAIPILEKAIRLQPNHVLANYDLGLAYYKENRYEEGIAVSKRALNDDPEMKYQRSNPGLGATANLGLCLMESGRREEALKCFDKNIGLIVPSFFNKGLTLYQLDRPKEAAVWFRRLLEIKPNDTSALNLLGQALDADGKFPEAVSCLKKAIKIDPKYALGYYDLGVILSRKKDGREEAMRCFKKAISLPLREPFPALAIYSIACLHALAVRKKEALDSLEQALERGYRNREHIDEDEDLNRIRSDARFKEMMKKYFGTAGYMAHQIEKAKRAGTYKEPEPIPVDEEWEKRRSKAQAQLRCIQDDCEYFYDSLPTLSCMVTGEQLCLMSMPDIEEIVEKCPYSGPDVSKWNAHLLR